MEITHRDDLGKDLQAPKLPRGQWSYDLVSQVQRGDRVLHWKSGSPAAIVGWSEVTGEPTTVPTYTWQPRGTSGRAVAPRTTAGWVTPLGGMRTFAVPTTLASLRALRDPLMDLRAELEQAHGQPIYFPFYRYGDDEVRTQQAYLVKFPIELFGLIPQVGSAIMSPIASLDDPNVAEDYQPQGTTAPQGRPTRANDPILRAAIERHSLDVALEYYEGIGGTDSREIGKPYDIAVTVGGVERHCEVKGSSMLIDTVELTINEVNHGKNCAAVDLIVVDDIKITRDKSTGEISAAGGRLRVWRGWSPADHALRPQKSAYLLPRQPGH
jgi:hypothetical protein